MKLAYGLGQFFITQWIWAVTFARAHPLVNLLVLLALLLFYVRTSMIPAVFYAFFSQLFTLIVFTLFVHGILDALLGITMPYDHEPVLIHPLATSFLLAMIYTGLQSLFFYICSYFFKIPLQKYCWAAFLSNVISMFIVYRFMAPV